MLPNLLLRRRARGLFVLVCVSCGVMAFGAMNSNNQGKTPGRPDWRVVEPVVYETVSLFPVLARRSADTTGFITLDEGLTSGDVVVAERGGEMIRRTRGVEPTGWERSYGGSAQVNQLVLVHRGKKALLLLAGEVVTGGKQDRVIAKDRIVPPGAEPLPLDVFCVERGRWAGGSTQFTAAKMMVHPSVREKAAVDQNQSEVWAAVRGDTSPRGTAATPAGVSGGVVAGAVGGVIASEAQSESYVKIYSSARVSGSVENFAEEISRRFARATADLKDEKVIGVVVAYGGEVAWADVFASPALFNSYWAKLLRSYCVEALTRSDRREKASLGDASEFLRPLMGRETVESEPGVYRWRQVSQSRHSEIQLEALAPTELMLHWCKLLRFN